MTLKAVSVRVEPRGAHYHLEFRGFGEPGSRPLLGTIVCSEEEAFWLVSVIAEATSSAHLPTLDELADAIDVAADYILLRPEIIAEAVLALLQERRNSAASGEP